MVLCALKDILGCFLFSSFFLWEIMYLAITFLKEVFSSSIEINKVSM